MNKREAKASTWGSVFNVGYKGPRRQVKGVLLKETVLYIVIGVPASEGRDLKCKSRRGEDSKAPDSGRRS